MFPSFIGILDIQSWWEVPSIAYFCSLFRSAFNLLDFDIEELEEALLTDGSEECASTLLTELIVRLLNGCLGNNDISAFNYQMFLRRLFRQKCQETGRYNPFNTDIDFQFLPLRTKVEILYALCDFRLDAEDVFELFKNLEAESLRVEPLGWDDNSSAYWYFYGTRLYREDYKQKSKNKKKKNKEEKRKRKLYGHDWQRDQDTERVWQVVCFTESDWNHLTDKFKRASSRVEKELYQSLSDNFLPEIPRLFQEKERLQRKRLLELAPRRTSNRVIQKIKQKEEEDKDVVQEIQPVKEEDIRRGKIILGREYRARRREQLRSKSVSSESSEHSSTNDIIMPQKDTKKNEKKKKEKKRKIPPKGELVVEKPVKTGRKTNNSLACTTGQIVIPETVDSGNSTRKKLKTSQIFSQSEEDIQTDMYKVLEQLTAHEDAWPFMDPVEEEYAPNYYAVIRRPMDLRKMEERLDSGYYTDFAAFKGDFKLIVNNCRLYNGQDNEYTVMVDSLQEAFDRLTERYIHRISSSDEEIAVEYQIPTPSRKHKMKQTEDSSSSNVKKKRKRMHSQSDNHNTSPEREKETDREKEIIKLEEDKNHNDKEPRKSKEGKVKKKHKQHHHHSKHSRSHKKQSHHKSSSKKEKHLKKLEKKKEKHRKRKHRQSLKESEIVLKRSSSQESLESSNRSRSASPLPSIHTPSPTPSPSPPPSDQLTDPDFFKDKYDKIKERRRQATKDNWDTMADFKQKNIDKQKQNLSMPDKDKNQKLRETIEKLKAKNDKYRETLIFNNLFSASSQTSADKSSISSETQAEASSLKDLDQYEFFEESDQESQKSKAGKKSKESHKKKRPKKISAAKNESATEALEQAVKDISKWLDDAPKAAIESSPNNSPALTISTEDSRLDDDFSNEKTPVSKKDLKKRQSSERERKIPSKRRELQRTIERLQPGKSKGNLLTNSPASKVEEVTPLGPHNKTREIKSVLTTKVDELSPKLSLGSVLPAVGFTLGKDHTFSEEEEQVLEKAKTPEPIVEAAIEDAAVAQVAPSNPIPEPIIISNKSKDEEAKEKESQEQASPKFSQEKATPNLSAWFKAFGAPKSVPPVKRKNDDTDQDEKSAENAQAETKPASPKNVHKYDSPTDEIAPTPEGGDSPILNVTTTPRQRRTSTGSSISERSSFSQDLDSPRHQIAHSSPLLRSPASPRTDSDFQKITYPIINGTVRAGFYQDTASIKSSPEKSCSPREAPQSPYSPYSQHVYASNNAAALAASGSNSGYFADHNKSPLPTYGLNQPPPYYDSSKAPVIHKPARSHDDYTALGPDTSYQQTPSQISGAYSPAPSPYSQHSQHSPYSIIPSSPQTIPQNSPASIPETKSPMFPAKKRSYNEVEIPFSEPKAVDHNNASDNVRETHKTIPSKDDYHKMVSSISTGSEFLPTSVDDIALALSNKKTEAMKVNALKENSGVGFIDRQLQGTRLEVGQNFNGTEDRLKQGLEHNIMQADKLVDNQKAGTIDMINMGYFVSELERKSGISDSDLLSAAKDLQKSNLSKGFDIGSIAMDLGMNKAHVNKYSQSPKPKGNASTNIEKVHSEHVNQNILEFDNIQTANQSISNYSLNDFDIANKKSYSSGIVPSCTAIDYGNWKGDSQRKPEPAHSNYQNAYSNDSSELTKLMAGINVSSASPSSYNKSLHTHQLQALAGATRAPMLRAAMQHNLQSELRIPNPRGIMKNDFISDVSTADSELIARNVDGNTMQKADKSKQNHSLSSSLQYKPPFSNHSSIPLDTLRNIPNLPQILERYTNDERYLSNFTSASSSLYHDKNLQMAQMFKSLPSEIHPTSNSPSVYSQASTHGQVTQADSRPKSKRRRAAETKHSQLSGNPSYHSQPTEILSSVKPSLVPGSAFNFGPSAGMGLSSGLYSDNSGFSLEDFRNSTANQFMAANYMAAAAAAHQRNTSEANVEKLVKPAHQNIAHSGAGTFPFIGHSQVRGSYPFGGVDASSPLYQQYLQRHQEELLRQTGAQIMGLYPPAYHPSGLGTRQPYDSMNRQSWL